MMKRLHYLRFLIGDKFTIMQRMVFTSILRRLFSLAALSVMSSCVSYRSLDIEFLQPAETYIEAQNRVALLDRGIRMKDSRLIFTDTLTEKSLFTQFANGMNYIFTDAGRDTVVPLQAGKRLLITHTGFPEILSDRQVEHYCGLLQTDYLLSIELQLYPYTEPFVQCKRLIRFYRSHNPFLVDSFILTDTLPVLEIYSSKDLLTGLKAASWDQGAKSARKMVPNWERTERRIYNGEKMLKVGDVLWQNGDQEQAKKIWEAARQHKDRIAVQACMNLAWYYENAGNYEEALKCLNQAKEKIKNPDQQNEITVYLKYYMKLLKQRIAQREELYRQMAE